MKRSVKNPTVIVSISEYIIHEYNHEGNRHRMAYIQYGESDIALPTRGRGAPWGPPREPRAEPK